ncbi:3-deoxy-manno-octulosonate cytidylyltransferase [Thalassotalea sp. PP2-459]|uniref:3-deoxy-manno-octulosonate cytidylyltransferase n=1 Tax=Thalassotalea sp. PP2-459 TaxID=1742724 RepID=UPI00094542D9|nr:3-deoxy-manno-octulosonate cytidylyltransferase [Thalassotalea sp. PP2-459]OKY27919.1 3-deoxy-manno-octulosonate cytidylyltransferase [Thalassotalea sp. PP2-459]
MSFVVVIPARFESSRLPGKVLADIHGKPMIQWVVEKAVKSGAEKVIVATDNQQVAKVVEGFGGEVCLTRADHQSGTERLAEVVEKYQFEPEQVVVNVQGDEPFIPPENIAQVASNLANQQKAKMATLAVHITDAEEAFNPNAVKVLMDKQGYALYFSRATIPYDRERFLTAKDTTTVGDYYLRHIGIYAYRASFINEYIQWPASELEQIESLEQLRVLWQGEKIHVAVAQSRLPVEGVDTPEDLAKAIAFAAQITV